MLVDLDRIIYEFAGFEVHQQGGLYEYYSTPLVMNGIDVLEYPVEVWRYSVEVRMAAYP